MSTSQEKNPIVAGTKRDLENCPSETILYVEVKGLMYNAQQQLKLPFPFPFVLNICMSTFSVLVILFLNQRK